jgi:hypothetical protein
VDEFDKRLGEILDEHTKAINAVVAEKVQALDDLHRWFNENYDGMQDVPWPKEV